MNKRKFSNVVWGIILLLIAAGLVLAKLDVPGMELLKVVSLWQILLGVGFGSMFLESLHDRSYTGAMFSLAFLCIVFNKQLHIQELVPWTILVVALLASIALNLIFGKSKRHYNKNYNNNGNYNYNGGFQSGNNKQSRVQGDTVEGERIFEKVTFGAATKYIHSNNFQSADLSCSFGGMEIYFDNVKVPSGHATINVSSSFSGMDIYIPRDWKIINELTSFCGGVDIDSNWTGDDSVVVTITGQNNFGGVEITRV